MQQLGQKLGCGYCQNLRVVRGVGVVRTLCVVRGVGVVRTLCVTGQRLQLTSVYKWHLLDLSCPLYLDNQSLRPVTGFTVSAAQTWVCMASKEAGIPGLHPQREGVWLLAARDGSVASSAG